MENDGLEPLVVADDVRKPNRILYDAQDSPNDRHPAQCPQCEGERQALDRHAEGSPLARESHPAEDLRLRAAAFTQRIQEFRETCAVRGAAQDPEVGIAHERFVVKL